jgi:M6 family metalloprotease-like protein
MISVKGTIRLICILPLAGAFAITLLASHEMEQWRALRKESGVRAKRMWEAERRFRSDHPELWPYLDRTQARALGPGLFAAERVITHRVLVLRVEFQEDTTSLTTGNGKMDLEPKGEPYDPEDGSRNLDYDPPHDSLYFNHQMEALHNYWWASSHGKCRVEFEIYPKSLTESYQLPYQMTYYGDPDNYVTGLFTLFRDVIAAADADEEARPPFRQFDHIIIFHAGCSWQAQAWLNDSPYDIPAVTIGGADAFFGEPIRTSDGAELSEAIIYPESNWHAGLLTYLQGGLAHEFGHVLGFPDLYDISYETIGVGGWALMGTGNWNLDGLVPPRPCAFSLEYMGCENPLLVERDTVGVRIARLGSESTLPRTVKVPLNAHEYFLIANRIVYQADTTSDDPDSSDFRIWRDGVLVKVNDYDFSLPPEIGEGGLAIWHVDRELVRVRFEEPADPDSYNVVNVGEVKGVDMEEADGVQDFELKWWEVTDNNAAFYGTPYDVFSHDSASGSASHDRFDYTTNPHTADNTGTATRIVIENISVSDTVMTFDVRFDWTQAGFPIEVDGIFDVNSPNVADLDGDGSMDIVLSAIDTSGGGAWVRLFAFRSDGSPLTDRPAGDGLVYAIPSDTIYGSVSVGDIAEGTRLRQEIACATYGGQVYVWHTTWDPGVGLFELVDGFPVFVGKVVGSPLVVDLDGDGYDEVIVGSNDRKLHAWHGRDTDGDGEADPVDGFPIQLDQWVWGTPVWAEGYLYAMSGDGRLFVIGPKSGRWEVIWSVLEPSLAFTSTSPVVGDLDGDDTLEVLVASGNGVVYCLDEEGELEWERALPDTVFYSTPALGDVDQDGTIDVVLAAGSKLYGFSRNGALLENFPIETGSQKAFQSSVVVGDIDGDGDYEITIGSIDGRLLAYHHTGRPVAGFPLATGGPAYSTPSICDLDRDGDVEVVMTSDGGSIQVWDLAGRYEPDNVPWPMLHRGSDRNGLLPTLGLPGEEQNELLPQQHFYLYPNPATGATITVRYRLGQRADRVGVHLFDVSGDLMTVATGRTDPGDHDLPVEIGRLVSGYYLCRLEAIRKGEQSVVFKPFAIVR